MLSSNLMQKNANQKAHLWGKNIFSLLSHQLYTLIYEERKWLLGSIPHSQRQLSPKMAINAPFNGVN
jgi:hypothetical protein